MKVITGFDQAVDALPRLPSSSSREKAVMAMARHEQEEDAEKLAEAYLETGCLGPAGLWPCALDLGHGGDHVRARDLPEGVLGR